MPGAETEKKTETPVVEEKTPVEQMKEKVAEEGKFWILKVQNLTSNQAKNGDKKTEDKPVAAKEGDADADSSDEKKEEEKSDDKGKIESDDE